MHIFSRSAVSGAFCAAVVSLAFALPSFADAPTDIVPQGSAINDAFALLNRYDLLSPNAVSSSFAGRPRYTRSQFAAVFKTDLLDNKGSRSRAQTNKRASEAVRSVLLALRPELEMLHVDVRAALRDFPQSSGPAAASFIFQPEGRFRTGGDDSGKTQTLGVYRATAQGEIGSSFRYVASVSSWPHEYRRDFYNDTGENSFSFHKDLYLGTFVGPNELYVEGRAGRHNSFTYSVGRRYENWGPGTRNGAVLLSDNAPALYEIRFAFPFNLGKTLGRDWFYTQNAGIFDSDISDKQTYFEARRIERHFSPQWSVEMQDAIITTDSDAAKKLFFLPLAVNSIQRGVRQTTGIRLSNSLDERLNYTVAAGISYQSTPRTRAYGQFFIDDLKNPVSGAKKSTPRKIAYLVGGTAALGARTELTIEYATADPTTYTFRNKNAPWRFSSLSNNFGLPSGPNFQEIFARVSHMASPKVLLSLEGRDRRRKSDSYPAPTAREAEAAALYRLDKRSSVELSYRIYQQNPIPLANYPVINPNAVDPTQADGGTQTRHKEIQLAYRFLF